MKHHRIPNFKVSKLSSMMLPRALCISWLVNIGSRPSCVLEMGFSFCNAFCEAGPSWVLEMGSSF